MSNPRRAQATMRLPLKVARMRSRQTPFREARGRLIVDRRSGENEDAEDLASGLPWHMICLVFSGLPLARLPRVEHTSSGARLE